MDSAITICPIINELKVKWEKVLVSRYGDSFMPSIELAVKTLEEIACNFYRLGLNDDHFGIEIMSGDEAKYHQRMTEILVSDRLLRDGFNLSSKKKGPDFKAEKNGEVIWFEVITPTPDITLLAKLADKKARLSPDAVNATNICHEFLLKMTGAVKEKYEKIQGYIRDGIIKDDDQVIIIVNDSLMSPLDVYMVGLTYEMTKGNSGLPLAVEAFLGIGNATWVEADGEGYQLIWRPREFVRNKNNAPIFTNYFLNEHYKDLSGVFVLTLREDYGLSRVFYGDNKNRGGVLTNEHSSRPFSNSIDSAQLFDHIAIKKLMQFQAKSPRRSMMTKTFYGYYFDMINELNSRGKI